MLTFLRENFNKQRNIVDIGANIGNHSLFFAKYMECEKVISFEPICKNIELFKMNLEKYRNKCVLYETALSNEEGLKVMYNTDEKSYGGFSLNKEDKSFEIIRDFRVEKLDNYDLTNITLMKIDVENHEKEVLEGAKETIKKNKPIIVLENSYYYFSHIFPNPNPHREIFEELGYEKIFSNVKNSSMDIWKPK